VSADEAVKVVRSGDRVFLHTAAATPRRLVEAMTARAGELSGVEVLSLHTEGEAPYATFLIGTRRLYDFVDDNPLVMMRDVAFVNDTAVIRQNPKAVAINSAIEVDLTGQVCADSIGTRIYSGVGGRSSRCPR
jgi:acyl-CoA hydrolase